MIIINIKAIWTQDNKTTLRYHLTIGTHRNGLSTHSVHLTAIHVPPPIEVRPYQIAPIAYTKDDDGLAHEWQGTVWMNPPYSRVLLRQFCEKMAAYGNGIALLVNRQDNLLWQEVIFPSAKSMIFMRHRVKFIRPDGTTGSPFFGSCLVAWGDECDLRLRNSGIEGKYVVLNI